MNRVNLNGTLLRIVTRLDNSYTYDVQVEKIGHENGTNFTYELKGGFAVNVLLELSHYLNFSYFVIPELGLTYSFEKALNLSIDVFAASYALNAPRALLADPTFVTGNSRVQIFINHEFESSMTDLVLVPLTVDVWLCFLLSIFLLSFSFGLSVILLEKVNLTEGIFHIVYICLQKGGKLKVRFTTSQLLIWMGSMLTMIIMASYSGKCVSISTVKRFTIDSLEKLVNSHFDIGFDVGYQNGSVIEKISKELTGENGRLMLQVLNKVTKSKFRFDTFEKSIIKVAQKPFAYIIDEETGYAAIQKVIGYFPCDWGTVPFAKLNFPWVLFLKKRSPYRRAINSGIQKLSETGIMKNLIRRWIPRGGGCSHGLNERGVKIQFTQMQTAFLILLFGSIISLIFLLIEYAKVERFWKHFRTSQN